MGHEVEAKCLDCGRTLTVGGCGAACALAGLLTFMTVVCASGCRTGGSADLKNGAESQLSEAIDPVKLRAGLDIHLDMSLASIIALSSDIAAETKDRRVREASLRWKIHSHDKFMKWKLDPDPRRVFLQYWVDTVMVRRSYEHGKRGKFLDDQPRRRITKLLQEMEKDLVDFGCDHFPLGAISAAKDDIDRLVEQYLSEPTTPSWAAAQSQDLLDLVSTPLLPARAIWGVTDTPQAISQFTDATIAFTGTVENLPERARWHAELLLLEMESLDTVQTSLKEFGALRLAVDRIAQWAEKAPERISTEFQKAVKAVESIHPKLQATVADVRKTAQQLNETAGLVNKALNQSDKTIKSVEAAAGQLKVTAGAWKEMTVEARALLADYDRIASGTDDKEEEATVEDYAELARTFRETVQDARILLAEARAPWPEGGGASAGMTAVVDAAFWRAIVLVAFVFLSAMAYRFITRRVRRER